MGCGGGETDRMAEKERNYAPAILRGGTIGAKLDKKVKTWAGRTI